MSDNIPAHFYPSAATIDDKMEARRRRSGGRTLPARAAQQKIDTWRENINRPNVGVDREGELLSGAPSTAFNDTKTRVLDASAGRWGGYALPGTDVGEDIVAHESKRTYFYDNVTELQEQEWYYTGGSLEPQNVGASSSVFSTYEAGYSLGVASSKTYFDQQGDFRPAPSKSPVFDNILEADTILPPSKPRGDLPIVDKWSRNVPYNARTFMAPYGFYDEDLLKDPPGVQVIESTANVQFAGVDSPWRYADNKNPNDDMYEATLAPRPLRGMGDDYYDWLPRSAKHAFIFAQPFVKFPSFSDVPLEDQCFWDVDPSTLYEAIQGGQEPTSNSSATPEKRSFPLWPLAAKRAVQEVHDLVDPAVNDAAGGPTVRFARERERVNVEKGLYQPSASDNHRGLSIIDHAGLWVGFTDPNSSLPDATLVMSPESFRKVREVFSEEEWMVEVGITPITAMGALEVFFLSTQSSQDEGEELTGETIPRRGFALSYTLTSSFIVFRAYISREFGDVVVLSDSYVMDQSFESSDWSARVCLSRKGSEFSLKATPQGVKHVPYSPGAVDLRGLLGALLESPGISTLPPTLQSMLDDILDGMAERFTALDGGLAPITGEMIFSLVAANDPAANIEELLGQAFPPASARVSGFAVLDDRLVIPSLNSMRVSPLSTDDSGSLVSGINPWYLVGEKESSRITVPTIDALVSALGEPPVEQASVGYCLGGIAIHDSVITDPTDLTRESWKSGNLGWSGWLSPRQGSQLINELEWDARSKPGLDGVLDGCRKDGSLTARYLDHLLWTGQVEDLGQTRVNLGFPVASWKAGALWSGAPYSNFKTGRPWGYSCKEIKECADTLLGHPDEDRGLRLKPRDGHTLPTHTTWGARFEWKHEDGANWVKKDSLQTESVDIEDLFRLAPASGSPTVPAETLSDIKNTFGNYEIGVWVTLLDFRFALVGGHEVLTLYSLTGVASLDLILTQQGNYVIRAVMGGLYPDSAPCVVEVELDPDQSILNLPLYITLGTADVLSDNNSTKTLDKIAYLDVRSPDQPEMEFRTLPGGDLTQGLAMTAIVEIPHDSTRSISLPAETTLTIAAPSPRPHSLDFIFGGLEIRRHGFKSLRGEGVVDGGADGSRSTDQALGRLAKDAGTFFYRAGNDLTQRLRVPYLEANWQARCGSLWGYTGRARILPDPYGISAIDGVGAHLWSPYVDDSTYLQTQELSIFTGFSLQPSPHRVASLIPAPSPWPVLWEKNSTFADPVPANSLRRIAAPSKRSPLVRVNSNSANFPKALSRTEVLEAAQQVRSQWVPRGFPWGDPLPSFLNVGTDDNVSGQFMYRREEYSIYAPFALVDDPASSNAHQAFADDPATAVRESLSHVLPRTNMPPSLTTPETLADFTSPSRVYSGSVMFSPKRYGQLELQRIRNETHPYLDQEGRNVVVVPVAVVGGEYSDFTGPSGEPGLSLYCVTEPDGDGSETFPTYSKISRGASFPELDWLLLNAAQELTPTVWSYRQDGYDFGSPSIDSGALSENPASHGVWVPSPGGRQLLYSPPSHISLDDDFLAESLPSALTGKGIGGWAKSLWAVSQLSAVGPEGKSKLATPRKDSSPPDLAALADEQGWSDMLAESMNRIPLDPHTEKPLREGSRLYEVWKDRRHQRPSLEWQSGLPSLLWVDDGHLPNQALPVAARWRSSALGFPALTEREQMLAEEAATFYQMEAFPRGVLDDLLSSRSASLWIEMGGLGRGSNKEASDLSRVLASGLSESLRFAGKFRKAMLPALRYPIAAPFSAKAPRVRGHVVHSAKASPAPLASSNPATALSRDLFVSAEEPQPPYLPLIYPHTSTSLGDNFPVVSAAHVVINPHKVNAYVLDNGQLAPSVRDGGFSDKIGDVYGLSEAINIKYSHRQLVPFGNRYDVLSPVTGLNRHTFLNPNVAREFNKWLWGFGDGLRETDYRDLNRGLSDLSVDVGSITPSRIALPNADAPTKQATLERLYEVALEEHESANESPPIALSAWHRPLKRRKNYNSVRPSAPNVRAQTYHNKTFWTRDTLLSKESAKILGHENADRLWQTSFNAGGDLTQSVEVLPRGFYYGLENTNMQTTRYALNPRSWGQFGDIQRLDPDAPTFGSEDFTVQSGFYEGNNIKTIYNSPSKYPYMDVSPEYRAELIEALETPPSLPEPITKEEALDVIRRTRIPSKPSVL